jgi:hypothetical protein
MPNSHREQTFPYVPASHDWHWLEPTSLVLPTEHSKQELEFEVGEYSLIGQLLHNFLPE